MDTTPHPLPPAHPDWIHPTQCAAIDAGHALAEDGWSRLLANQAVGAAARGEVTWALILAHRAYEVADRRDEAVYQAFLAALSAVVPTPMP